MSNKVKHFRENKNLTQKELAMKSGITREYLSNIERGMSDPSIPVAINIAKALKVNINKIFFEESVNHSEQKENEVV